MKLYHMEEFGGVPNTGVPQTDALRRALEAAAKEGGTVVLSPGDYVIGGVRMYDNTELHLAAGARLLGSEDPWDYPVYDLPEGFPLHTDIQMVPAYFVGRNAPRPEYRRALISAYGARNVAITGEGASSVIDGRDCFDPAGEEGMRGPHGIFFSCCHQVTLCDYTIANCGNFHHQIDTSTDVAVRGVTALGGHDGFHLHCCEHVEIADCVLHTGDDCVAGMNMSDISVHDCDLNTSCQIFRIGGNHIHVVRCHLWGPGIYPYRRTIVIDRDHILPREAGHHRMNSLIEYFASPVFPQEGSFDIVLRDCTVENPGRLLAYHHTKNTTQMCAFHNGTPFRELTLENVRITGLHSLSFVEGVPAAPLTVYLRNVTAFDESGDPTALFDPASTDITVKEQ